MWKRVLAGLGVLCVLSGAVVAQPQGAVAAAAKPAFVIADVHDSPHKTRPFSDGGQLRGDQYSLRQSTIIDMIAAAYGVDAEMIQGGPSWLEMKRFELVGKADPKTSQADVKLMLQSLLAERFKLVMHQGETPMPAYVLTAPGGKTKMKQSDGDGLRECHPEGAPPAPGTIAPIALGCTNSSLEELAQFLHQLSENPEPVVNQTGLEGKWDFSLKWTPKGQLVKAGADGIPLVEAVDKQLGLKMELKTAPQRVWIVDSVNEEPTPNRPEVAKELPPPPPLQFDVATIKPAKPDAQMSGRINGGQMDLKGVTLKLLMVIAWDLNPNDNEMIANAPKWLNEDKFDILAKVALPLTASGKPAVRIDNEDLHNLLRALLIERFKMQVRMEDRPISAYTLMVDHPKMKEADPKSRTRCQEGPGSDGKDPRATSPVLNRLVTCQNMTTKQMGEIFALQAGGYIYSPVLDATGLKGSYDFTLSFSSADQTILKPVTSTNGQQQTAEPNGALSFFDAVNKQLGLKLVKEKRPVPVLVIDHLEETPTEN